MKKILLSTLIVLFVWQASFACNAAFSYAVAPLPGSPYRVVFTNTSDPGIMPTITSGAFCKIFFGDGDSASIAAGGTVAHSYAVAGTYIASLYITVEDTLAGTTSCSNTFTRSITLSTTDVKSIETAGDAIRLFPNPAANVIHISGLSPAEEATVVTISDIAGRKIDEQVCGFDASGNGHLKTDRLVNGVYFIHFQRAALTITRQIVISK